MGAYFLGYDEADGPPDPHGRHKALFPASERDERSALDTLIDNAFESHLAKICRRGGS